MLDIHTHHAAPQPEGLISVEPDKFNPIEGQSYSIGIHPWSYGEATSKSLQDEEQYGTDASQRRLDDSLESFAALPQVLAIGESGIDLTKGGPMFRQLQIFKRHVDLSESLGKPLIIHCVKAYDVILGLKRDLAPKQNWCIHGFRGKPAAAAQLLDKGIYLSLGEHFNEETLRLIVSDEKYLPLLLAETDESPLSIAEIISRLASAASLPPSSLLSQIETNANRFLGM